MEGKRATIWDTSKQRLVLFCFPCCHPQVIWIIAVQDWVSCPPCLFGRREAVLWGEYSQAKRKKYQNNKLQWGKTQVFLPGSACFVNAPGLLTQTGVQRTETVARAVLWCSQAGREPEAQSSCHLFSTFFVSIHIFANTLKYNSHSRYPEI